MIEGHANQAILSVINSQQAYCKFLSANDTGLTGGHQAGIYISKPSIPILFNEPGERGLNKEKWVKIKWQDDFETDTRFIIMDREQETNIALQISDVAFLSCVRSIQVHFSF